MARILVIDDEAMIRRLLQDVLSRHGHHVETAGDGEEGLRKADGVLFDLVITDLLMPGMEGMETILELRRRQPALRILAMSGSSQPDCDYLRMAISLSADAALSKPFDIRQLLETVGRLLSSGAAAPVLLHAA